MSRYRNAGAASRNCRTGRSNRAGSTPCGASGTTSITSDNEDQISPISRTMTPAQHSPRCRPVERRRRHVCSDQPPTIQPRAPYGRASARPDAQNTAKNRRRRPPIPRLKRMGSGPNLPPGGDGLPTTRGQPKDLGKSVYAACAPPKSYTDGGAASGSTVWRSAVLDSLRLMIRFKLV